MLGRGAANIADSQHKLEEIERQLRVRLERAREVAATAGLDDPALKTREEQMSDLEVAVALFSSWRCPSSTRGSTTTTSTGGRTSRTR